MAKLIDLGFSKGIIFETIVSTYNHDGTPNAAPMGAIMQNSERIKLNIYNSSTTSFNLKTNKCAVINITSNIELFFKTAFKEVNVDGKLPQDWFEKSEAVAAPKLQLADATVDVSNIDLVAVGGEKTSFSCRVEQVNISKMCPQVYCRAMGLTLEAIIHGTRVKAFAKDEKKKQQVEQLLQIIGNCNDLINRTASNSVYSDIMSDLMKRINSWRNNP